MILALAALYISLGDVAIVDALFLGVKATVVVIVIQALLRVAKKELISSVHKAIAVIAFVGLFFLNIPYPLIILGAAIVGAACLRQQADQESIGNVHHSSRHSSLPSWRTTVITILVGLAIWWIPVFLLDYFVQIPILSEMATFFSTLAVVTFGGAYSVLAYMTQDVVAIKGWLTTP